jgi:hypothetical protein
MSVNSVGSSTEIQMWQLPAKRFPTTELNLIDKTRTNDGDINFTVSKQTLDKATPVRTEVTVCISLLEIPDKHSFSSCQLLFHEVLPHPYTKLSITPDTCVMDRLFMYVY